MTSSMAKHRLRLHPTHIAAPADASLCLLMNRVANDGQFIVKGSREARAALRKAMHLKRKREFAETGEP